MDTNDLVDVQAATQASSTKGMVNIQANAISSIGMVRLDYDFFYSFSSL